MVVAVAKAVNGQRHHTSGSCGGRKKNSCKRRLELGKDVKSFCKRMVVKDGSHNGEK